MKPSERVALGKALEDLERTRARERQADGAAVRYGLPSEKFSEGKGNTRDIVGAAIAQGLRRPLPQLRRKRPRAALLQRQPPVRTFNAEVDRGV
jgi:hypothetical protein